MPEREVGLSRKTSSQTVQTAKEDTQEAQEETLDAAYEALPNSRRTWELSGDSAGDAFYTHILGSAWTREKKKRAYDGIAAQARGGEPTKWARSYGLNSMATFATKKYGDQGASMCVVEWARRMQHYYDLYLQAGDPDFQYDDALLDSYKETDSWVAFLAEQAPGSLVLERASDVRMLRPLPKRLRH